MKKIKFLFIAMAAMLTSATFTACSSDDNNDVVNNPATYQDQVDQIVKDGKKHNKVILLVAFGSTWQQAYDSFDATRAEYQKKFGSNYDVFLSFSSAICINRAAAAENTEARAFYEPKYWLESFGRVQYQEIVVQSMQVISGEEFSRVVNAMKDFANNSNGDLDVNYMAKFAFNDDGTPGENQLKLGLPLMQTRDDAKILAGKIDKYFASYARQGAMLFMGHGNPDEYDTYQANRLYDDLEEELQAINATYAKNYFVGTVDMKNNFKVQVRDDMQAAGITSGKVYCAPLMTIAGDHAHNDMADADMIPHKYNEAGDDLGPVTNFSELEVNDEGEVDDCSWRVYFGIAGSGYTIDESTFTEAKLVKGLLDYPEIRDIYIDHTTKAEAKDYYHSKLPE